MNGDSKNSFPRNLLIVLLIWACFPLFGILIHELSNDELDLAGMNLHLLVAMGSTVAVTIFFGLQQRELALYSKREYELKQSPHVLTSEVKVSSSEPGEFIIMQKLTNVGMGSVFVSGARIEFSGMLNTITGGYRRRGRCLCSLPVQIKEGTSHDFKFQISLTNSIAYTENEKLTGILESETAWYLFDAEVVYQIRNAGANEVREVIEPVLLSEKTLEKRLLNATRAVEKTTESAS